MKRSSLFLVLVAVCFSVSGLTVTADAASLFKFSEISFWEGGDGSTWEGYPVYAAQFPKSRARFINYKVLLEVAPNSKPAENQPHKLTFEFHNKSQNFLQEFSRVFTLKSAGYYPAYGPQLAVTGGWGWKEPGKWPVGIYTVKIYADDGEFIGQSYFEITNN